MYPLGRFYPFSPLHCGSPLRASRAQLEHNHVIKYLVIIILDHTKGSVGRAEIQPARFFRKARQHQQQARLRYVSRQCFFHICIVNKTSPAVFRVSRPSSGISSRYDLNMLSVICILIKFCVRRKRREHRVCIHNKVSVAKPSQPEKEASSSRISTSDTFQLRS